MAKLVFASLLLSSLLGCSVQLPKTRDLSLFTTDELEKYASQDLRRLKPFLAKTEYRWRLENPGKRHSLRVVSSSVGIRLHTQTLLSDAALELQSSKGCLYCHVSAGDLRMTDLASQEVSEKLSNLQ